MEWIKLERAPLEILRVRSEFRRFIRNWFESRGFCEVETPLLSRDTCVDAWLDPIETQIAGQQFFLQTSPEFAMKRLLCAGAQAIYQLCKAFREGEVGARHNPEFTMLEWYQPNSDLDGQMQLVEQLIRDSFQFANEQGWSPRCSLPGPIKRITYDHAFRQFCDISAMDSTTSELLCCAQEHGMQCTAPDSIDRDDMLNFLLAHRVEPEFEKCGGVFLYDFPASQAALATTSNSDPPVAKRFELYLRGVEICNGYQELTDPEELARRMAEQNQKRIANNRSPLPEDSQLLQAMRAEPLPECSGVALGFDRLLMLCRGSEQLSDVLSFPFPTA